MKERHDPTRIRPRKKVQEDPETERSWGVKESGRVGTTAQRVHGMWGMGQQAVGYL